MISTIISSEGAEWHGIARLGSGMVVSQAVAIATGAALSVLLARWLGPEGYGLYLLVLAIAQTLATPILAGLPTLVTRQIAICRAVNDWASLRGIIRWSVNVAVSTSALIMLAVATYLVLRGGADTAYLLALPLVVGLVAMRLASAVIQGFERPFWGNLPDTAIRPVLLLLLVTFAALLGLLSPSLAVGAHIAAAMLAAAWAILYCRRHLVLSLPEQRSSLPRMETRKWLLSLLPLSLLTTASIINSRLDVLMLGFLAHKSDVALYGIALQFAGLATLTRTITFAIAGPKFARFYAEDEPRKLKSLVQYTKLFNLVGALLVAIAIATAGERVIVLLTGSVYKDAAWFATLLCVPILVEAVMGPSALLLVMSGNERVSARLAWCMVLINAILNVFLIPRLGVTGAIVSTTVSEFFWHVSSVFAARRLVGINTLWLGNRSIVAEA